MYRAGANRSPVAHDIEQESNNVMMQYMHGIMMLHVWGVRPCQERYKTQRPGLSETKEVPKAIFCGFAQKHWTSPRDIYRYI